jgi:hypothetical protein
MRGQKRDWPNPRRGLPGGQQGTHSSSGSQVGITTLLIPVMDAASKIALNLNMYK